MSKKKKSGEEEVTLNVTAMLDMAFQLLAFFVLTFKPPPAEGQIFLKLPPAMAVLGAGGQAAGQDEKKDPKDIKPVKSLTVALEDRGTGSVTDVSIGRPDVGKLKPIPYNELDAELHDYVSQQGYDQLIVQVSPTMRWEEVMKITDLVAKLTVGKSDKLPSLSYIASGGGQSD